MTGNEAVTHTDSEKGIHLKIKFRIEKFKALMNSTEPGEGSLWSEGVTSELAPRAVWKLKVHPNGWKEEHRGNISAFLHLTGPMKNSKEGLDASYCIYLVDGSDGSKIDVVNRCTRNFGMKYYGWGCSHVSHDRVKKALHEDGSLLAAADIDFLPPDDGGAKVISESALQGYEDLQQWATKFSELHGDEASSDCTIEIGGVSIPAHKSILAAHSPKFRSMFTHQEEEEAEEDESQSGTIKVADCSLNQPEPMRALVHYCYQGQLDDATIDGKWAVKIFQLADRYRVAGLKGQLEKHFVDKRLSKENVVAMAVLADTYTAPKLREACIKLIVREGDAIYESADWKELEEARPKLAIQLAIEAIRVLNKKR